MCTHILIIIHKGETIMSNNKSLMQTKLDLLRKIINARLTKEEYQIITKKAQDIVNRK